MIKYFFRLFVLAFCLKKKLKKNCRWIINKGLKRRGKVKIKYAALDDIIPTGDADPHFMAIKPGSIMGD